MAKLKNADIRELSTPELKEKLHETKTQYKKKQFAHAVTPLENPLELRWIRKDIARLNTELTNRQKAENNA
jgi:large subunit ribosomal protein L29